MKKEIDLVFLKTMSQSDSLYIKFHESHPMKNWAHNTAFWFLISGVFAIGVFFSQTAFAAASPSITTQPQGQSVLVGSNAVFTIVATGQSPLAYQWSFKGTNLANNIHIDGSTNTTLTVSNVIATDAGIYRVVVSNSHGSVTSSNAALT